MGARKLGCAQQQRQRLSTKPAAALSGMESGERTTHWLLAIALASGGRLEPEPAAVSPLDHTLNPSWNTAALTHEAGSSRPLSEQRSTTRSRPLQPGKEQHRSSRKTHCSCAAPSPQQSCRQLMDVHQTFLSRRPESAAIFTSRASQPLLCAEGAQSQRGREQSRPQAKRGRQRSAPPQRDVGNGCGMGAVGPGRLVEQRHVLQQLAVRVGQRPEEGGSAAGKTGRAGALAWATGG